MVSIARARKQRIRSRDKRRHKKSKMWICALCGRIAETQIHHFAYTRDYDSTSYIEVCIECHRKIDSHCHH